MLFKTHTALSVFKVTSSLSPALYLHREDGLVALSDTAVCFCLFKSGMTRCSDLMTVIMGIQCIIRSFDMVMESHSKHFEALVQH